MCNLKSLSNNTSPRTFLLKDHKLHVHHSRMYLIYLNKETCPNSVCVHVLVHSVLYLWITMYTGNKCHSYSLTTLFIASMINALVCNCVFLSTCTGLFHPAAEYVACNYLLMCHSIRQSCDPWWLLDSPENSPRLSHTAFNLNFQLTSVTQWIIAVHTTICRHMHTNSLPIRAFTKTHNSQLHTKSANSHNFMHICFSKMPLCLLADGSMFSISLYFISKP